MERIWLKESKFVKDIVVDSSNISLFSRQKEHNTGNYELIKMAALLNR